jgi:hypothetical protein
VDLLGTQKVVIAATEFGAAVSRVVREATPDWVSAEGPGLHCLETVHNCQQSLPNALWAYENAVRADLGIEVRLARRAGDGRHYPDTQE